MKLKFGIPCSQLKNSIKDVEIQCTSEEQAFAIAAGCILAGKKPIVYMQNSGFGRCIDILTSLYLPYKIKYPHLILSLRKKPFHHAFIGSMTMQLIRMVGYTDIEVVEQNENEKNRYY